MLMSIHWILFQGWTVGSNIIRTALLVTAGISQSLEAPGNSFSEVCSSRAVAFANSFMDLVVLRSRDVRILAQVTRERKFRPGASPHPARQMDAISCV